MQKYKFIISYDGTHYGGWQAQINSVSIQSLIENALTTIMRIPTTVVGSGRTDAGVHAKGQVAHFIVPESIDLFRLLGSLNGILPPDIRILHIEPASADFHARYSAISKEYHYHLHLEPTVDPFKRLYAYHFFKTLDLDLLRAAATCFIGTHDFTSFANKGSSVKSPVRTITRLDVCPEPGGLRLEFEGNGFLYKMVRNITSTLISVASRKIPLETIPELFKARDRRLSPPAAAPQGLFLIKVKY